MPLKPYRLQRDRGVAMTETLIVLLLVIFLVMAIIQLALIQRVRITLESAAAESARAGALNNGQPLPFDTSLGIVNYSDGENAFWATMSNTLQRSSVWEGAVNGLLPLNTSEASVAGLVQAWAKTHAELMTSGCIEYLNPTQQSFIDWSFIEMVGPNRGVLQIPNDTLRYRKPLAYDFKAKQLSTPGLINPPTPPSSELRGAVSQTTIQDANVLHLRIHYGYALQVPVVNRFILTAWRINRGRDLTRFEDLMLRQGKLPLSAEGSEGMQTPIHWHPFYSLGPQGKGVGLLDDFLNGLDFSIGEGVPAAIDAASDTVNRVTGFIRNLGGSTFNYIMSGAVDLLTQPVGSGNAFCPALWGDDALEPLRRLNNGFE